VVRKVIELRVPEIGDCIDYRRICVISGFRREVDENCALLGCYAAGGGNSLATFRHNLSVPSSKVKDS
jgi:hypothetical protein